MGKSDMAAPPRTSSELPRGGDSLPRYEYHSTSYIINSKLRADSFYTETVCYNRIKDQESTTGKWFAELIKPNPWYNKVVPNVSVVKKCALD